MIGRYGVVLHAYVLMEDHCHLLKELGHLAGGVGIQAVSKACCMMGEKLKTDKGLKRTLARVGRFLDNGRK